MKMPKGMRSRRRQFFVVVACVAAAAVVALLSSVSPPKQPDSPKRLRGAAADEADLGKGGKEDKTTDKLPDPPPSNKGKTPWGYVLKGSEDYWSMVTMAECKGDGQYSMKDIEEHSTEKDFLLLIRGYVHNVTAFYSHHPGGPAILMGAKQDASEMFEGHHQPFVANMLGNFCVGKLIPDE
eukprot:TRINITY_DN40308_c0_g1_i1.p1 TRINITY_DN40308_c0_g1~~TRINITY_DN40308_c0_g1_i1.p1  ORF type:complete len:205 (+),score=50.85 TRINITY_DN40308_c0_g1_i1:73-615(+)